ncbi:MAG: transaldolase family protein [Candidatus Doudnabacteria bacterium]|nr:transaldolase family protein [Candidatus Doudnabacteria bacterium]
MKPSNLKTKIFLDSGDPKETREALALLGFLDGQTTNPSLVAKNPEAVGKKFSAAEVLNFYEGVVKEVSSLIPQGSVSVEVYADKDTSCEEMLDQAKNFYAWIPNAHIKYPTVTEGLKAAEISVKDGMRVNMTLVFNQAQAAAVYAATRSSKKGDVFLSPFVGRLDDRGENGMDFIANTIKMYQPGDGHVEVLVASVRSIDHFVKSIELGADIITSPLKILKQWAELGMPVTSKQQTADSNQLRPIPYEELDLNRPWQEYNIQHELTDKGIEKFASDWNGLIDKSK